MSLTAVTSPLYSPAWYRVARLRPRLQRHIGLSRHVYRGEPWYVLHNHATGHQHRLSIGAYRLLAAMDGRQTCQEIWQTFSALGDATPTQGEFIDILSRLHAADALQCDVTPDNAELFRRRQDLQRAAARQRLNPLALRIGSLDPDRWLGRTLKQVRPVYSAPGLVAWILVVVLATVLAAMHWDELRQSAVDRAFTTDNLLLLWLTYPFVKLLHELGHAYAVKHWGGEVHEIGLMLLVLTPLPFVNASAASAFPDKYQRIVVSAAGIMVELLLSALAMFTWLAVTPGLIQDIAFNVMLIGGISTIFANGNPLLRFDGYYVLADLVEIPNLALRSRQYLGYLLRRYIVGIREERSPVTATGERRWFVAYGVASSTYRITVLFLIALFVAGRFFVLGTLIAVWIAATQVVIPLVRAAVLLVTSDGTRNRRLRAVFATTTGVSIVVGVLGFMPVALATSAEGVLWLPEHAYVRASTGGFVVQILADDNSVVRSGDPLVALQDPLIPLERKLQESGLTELRSRYSSCLATDRAKAQMIAHEIETASKELDHIRQHEEDLIVRSPSTGRFIVPNYVDLPGTYVHQGDILGYVLDARHRTVRVVIPQADIGLVRSRTHEVSVRLASAPTTTIPAIVKREVPAATDQLPSAALGHAGGGQIAVDPMDPQGLHTREKLFQYELDLAPGSAMPAFGVRVYARFDHGDEPLARRWYRRARQLLLKRLPEGATG